MLASLQSYSATRACRAAQGNHMLAPLVALRTWRDQRCEAVAAPRAEFGSPSLPSFFFSSSKMFRIVSAADKAAALEATRCIKAWLGDLIVASERDVCTLMVTEVECKIPGCAPLEVVLIVLHDPDSEDDEDGASSAGAKTAPSARWVAKVMVPLVDVTAALVADAVHDADNLLQWRVEEKDEEEEALVAQLEVALEALAARQAARQLRDATKPPTLADVPGASLIARLDTLQVRCIFYVPVHCTVRILLTI